MTYAFCPADARHGEITIALIKNFTDRIAPDGVAKVQL